MIGTDTDVRFRLKCVSGHRRQKLFFASREAMRETAHWFSGERAGRIAKVKPLCIDLFCGLGGWSEAFLDEGYDCIGFDIERHDYGSGGYPGQLVLQDVLTLHGEQFRDATVIVASPPCQFFSRMAMPFRCPWKQEEFERRRNLALSLFWSCFRIAEEADVPIVIENVVGCQKWCGFARWHHRSFYLWGDIPPLMPIPVDGQKNNGGSWFGQRDGKELERNDPRDMRRNESGEFVNAEAQGGWNHPGKALDGVKNEGGSWFNVAHNTTSGKSQNPVHGRQDGSGTKVGGGWFGSYAEQKAAGTISPGRLYGKRSIARKAASAQIAKIPYPLAQWIARVFKP